MNFRETGISHQRSYMARLRYINEDQIEGQVNSVNLAHAATYFAAVLTF